ncbi:MAG TPA: lipid-binding SYLF domain-containing protein [Acidobacteriaceae bacterium]|nr:lipid-binding SYLF domain-containing protein [Acidobacteriaceae bacterium]
MRKTIAALTVGLLAAATSIAAVAQNKVDNELSEATQTIQSLTGPQSTAGIPDDVLKDAKCVAVIPKMLKAGFMVGGEHGDGFATCRTADGRWSPPAPFQLSGASFGAQIGGEEMGYIMMIMNDQGMQTLDSGHFKVGAGVNAAAGPVGRNASASGGWNAAILTYARARGAYAGATLNGAELNENHDATKDLYGRPVSFTRILDGKVAMPSDSAAHQFVGTVHHAVERAADQ